MSLSEDEELEQAIALSLQVNTPSKALVPDQSHEVVLIDSDDEVEDEDEQLQRAMALSLQEVSVDSHGDHFNPPSPQATDIISRTPQPATISQLDRKAMEQERLARLGKRKREASPAGSSSHVAQNKSAKSATSSDAYPLPRKAPTLQYPTGAIKRTLATKFPRSNDISIDEVLQASDTNIAVISSFMWESEWLWKKLNPLRVKQVWIMNVKDRETQERYTRDMKETGVPNLKIQFPPMGGMIANMHSKFMLLFGKDKLRIVVTTANMTPIDWGEVGNDWQPGVMENSVFLIDLPRRGDGAIGEKHELTNFGKEFVYFLEQQKIEQNIIDGVLKFEFSATDRIAFVHSIGGVHNTESDHPTGLPGLAKAVCNLNLDGIKNVELDYAASSLGSLTDTFLRRFYFAARGESLTPAMQHVDMRNKIRIYFPLHKTVQQSTGGEGCGGVICLAKSAYNAASFPKECLRDYKSTRRGMLSHNKLLFARGRKLDGKPCAWVYVGSANLSESAWGGQKMVKGKESGQLKIRNWECGIVMPVPIDEFEHVEGEQRDVPAMSVFGSTIELPFVYPGQAYDGQQPWYFKCGDRVG